MIVGQAVGVTRLIMDMIMPPPVCGSGEPDKRWSIMSRVDFLHFAIINAIICTTAMVGISLMTKPRTKGQVCIMQANEFVMCNESRIHFSQKSKQRMSK